VCQNLTDYQHYTAISGWHPRCWEVNSAPFSCQRQTITFSQALAGMVAIRNPLLIQAYPFTRSCCHNRYHFPPCYNFVDCRVHHSVVIPISRKVNSLTQFICKSPPKSGSDIILDWLTFPVCDIIHPTTDHAILLDEFMPFQISCIVLEASVKVRGWKSMASVAVLLTWSGTP